MEDKERIDDAERPEEMKSEQPVIREEEPLAEAEKTPVPETHEDQDMTREEKIETEWARTLQMDYDAGEVRRRAEEVEQRAAAQTGLPTPPPMPGNGAATPPPMPQTQQPAPYQAPAPYGSQQPTPQPPAPYGHPEPMPPTYLAWSVAATVLCCLIPGIVAIVYSTQVSSKYYARDYEGARKASEHAQYWIIASVVLGVVTAAVYFPLMMLVG